MKGTFILLCALLALGAPAFAQSSDALPPVREPAPEVVTKKKEIFSVRHPKLHKIGRKVRKTAQICQPVIQCLGSVGQIVTPFIIH